VETGQQAGSFIVIRGEFGHDGVSGHQEHGERGAHRNVADHQPGEQQRIARYEVGWAPEKIERSAQWQNRGVQPGVAPTPPRAGAVGQVADKRIGDGIDHQADTHRQAGQARIQPQHLAVVDQDEVVGVVQYAIAGAAAAVNPACACGYSGCILCHLFSCWLRNLCTHRARCIQLGAQTPLHSLVSRTFHTGSLVRQAPDSA
jgi:hypothetical protein